jgi:very-short-patch-repair endonuclease
MRKESVGEQKFKQLCEQDGIKVEETEYYFAKPRKFRADFAWPSKKMLVEIEGGTYINGRHNRGDGYESDCEKYNLAALDGWLVLRFTTSMLRKDPNTVINQVKQALLIKTKK